MLREISYKHTSAKNDTGTRRETCGKQEIQREADTDRQERQKDKSVYTQKNRQTYRQTYKQTNRRREGRTDTKKYKAGKKTYTNN